MFELRRKFIFDLDVIVGYVKVSQAWMKDLFLLVFQFLTLLLFKRKSELSGTSSLVLELEFKLVDLVFKTIF